jgi:hypothetical protein
MFKSLGNLAADPQVGLLFISMDATPRRLRVNGTVALDFDDPRLEAMPGAQILVKVTPLAIFPNCPRYIPNLEMAAPSAYIPHADQPPLEPRWKSMELFADVTPPRRR